MSRPAHSPHSIVRSSVSGATSVAATLPIVCRKGLDSGYTEASSSADSTQAQGEGSSSGDVVSKERYTCLGNIANYHGDNHKQCCQKLEFCPNIEIFECEDRLIYANEA